MDDLYTPINDMPGDSGQSASASGLTKLPIAHNTRYAKKNDIIQKYVKSADSKYIVKSANLKKLKLPKDWWKDIFESDTGGGKGSGSGSGGVKTSDYGEFVPIEYKPSGSEKIPITVAEDYAKQRQQWEMGRKSRDKDIDEKVKEKLDSETARARAEERERVLGLDRYDPGGFLELNIKPFKSLGRQAANSYKTWRMGRPKYHQEKPYVVAQLKQDRALPKIEDVDVAYERWLAGGRAPEALPAAWGDRTLPKKWYEKEGKIVTPEQDLQAIYNVENRKQAYDNALAEARYSYKFLPKALRNAAFRIGLTGYLTNEGGKSLGLWGNEDENKNKSNNVETIAPVPAPVSNENSQTNSSKSTPSGLKLPALNPADLDKRMTKRTGFAKKTNMSKAFGGKSGEEFIQAMQRDIDLMSDSNPVYRSAAEASWKNELRNLGIDDTITPAEFKRLYGYAGWDIPTIAQKAPYVPKKPRVIVGRRSGKTYTSATGASPSISSSGIDNTILRLGPLEATWNPTPVYGPHPRWGTQLGNIAQDIGAATVSTPKRAAITGAIGAIGALGLLGGGIYGASNLYSQYTRKPKPADGDKGIPDRILLPTMTPSAVAGTSNNSSVAPTKTNKERKKLAEATLTVRSQMWDDDKKKDMDEAYRILVKPFADAYVAEEYSNLGRMNTQDNINRLNAKQQQWSDIGQSADETKEWKNRESKVREGLKNLSNPYWNGTESSWFKNTFGQSPKSRMGKRANIRKAKATYVRSQSSPYSQTAYVQPTANARFALMTPEKQGAAVINSIGENTKQNYKNTASFLNNVLSNAIKDTVNAKNFATGFARGALGAADEQTQFTNNILPQMIVAGEKTKQVSKETAGKGLQVANVGKQFVVLAVKESAKGMPQMSGKLSVKAIKNEVDKLVSESPSVVKQLYNIGKQVLNKADELQPGVKKQFTDTVKNVVENTPVPTDKELGDRLKTFGLKPRTGRYDESNFAERVTKPIREYAEILSPTKQLNFGPKFDSRVRRDDYYSTGTMKDSYTTDKNRYSQKPNKEPQSMQYLDILNRGIKPKPPSASPVSAFEQGKTTKRMSTRANSMMFTKRLESPKNTQSQQTKNKYF
jgi:hypothetical protein